MVLEALEDFALPPVPEEAVLKGVGGGPLGTSSSRPDFSSYTSSSSSTSSSSQNYPSSSSFKGEYGLHKPGGATPSEVSKTESALLSPPSHASSSDVSKSESALLSPPSHASSSDVSKSESARQLSAGKGSLGGASSSKDSISSSSFDFSLTLLPSVRKH
ncbi:putative protein TPRXL, partial [Penaeus japonicus]|uniref:putative protein TPRXL n=1 Tax=Penaeus japonicus TaxID=27405 RepID=UPI001C70C10C